MDTPGCGRPGSPLLPHGASPRHPRNAIRTLALVALLAFSATTMMAQSVPARCGADRWPVRLMSDNRRPVKVLGDRDRDRVDFTPVDTTIAELASAPFHKHRPNDRRIEPEELQVYRIKARLLRVKLEMDADLHLRLADVDDPQQRIIAEIPAPECSVGTGHEEEYRAARAALNLIPVGSVVEVVGVAFFDFKHAAKGAARNAIELHPVLAIRSAQSPLAPAMATGPATQEPTLESRTVEPAEGDQ